MESVREIGMKVGQFRQHWEMSENFWKNLKHFLKLYSVFFFFLNIEWIFFFIIETPIDKINKWRNQLATFQIEPSVIICKVFVKRKPWIEKDFNENLQFRSVRISAFGSNLKICMGLEGIKEFRFALGKRL